MLPNGGQPSAQACTQAKADLLQISECMRAHGITDFPDPQPARRRATGRLQRGQSVPGAFLAIPNSINPQSPAFSQAAMACNFGSKARPCPRARDAIGTPSRRARRQRHRTRRVRLLFKPSSSGSAGTQAVKYADSCERTACRASRTEREWALGNQPACRRPHVRPRKRVRSCSRPACTCTPRPRRQPPDCAPRSRSPDASAHTGFTVPGSTNNHARYTNSLWAPGSIFPSSA